MITVRSGYLVGSAWDPAQNANHREEQVSLLVIMSTLSGLTPDISFVASCSLSVSLCGWSQQIGAIQAPYCLRATTYSICYRRALICDYFRAWRRVTLSPVRASFLSPINIEHMYSRSVRRILYPF